MNKINHFKYYKTSPEIIKLAVMYYIRYPLSLRQVAGNLHGLKVRVKTIMRIVSFSLTSPYNIWHT